jgi:hypothetical protein
MSEDLALFPTINPNLDEVAEENVILKVEEPKKLRQKDIFVNDLKNCEGKSATSMDKTNRVHSKEKPSEPVDVSPGDKPNSTSSNYGHLIAARAKGIITRKEKALIRQEKKAEAKRLKDIEKAKKREATKERNRDKARERYRRLKTEKEEPEPIKPQYIPNQNGMSFKKFANYMMQYEELKDRYKKQSMINKKSNKNIKVINKIAPPKVKEFPDNYPLAHIYGNNRFKTTDFNNF